MKLSREVKTIRRDEGNEIKRLLTIMQVTCPHDFSTIIMTIERNNDDGVLLSLDRKVTDKKHREVKSLQAHIEFLIEKKDFSKIFEILQLSKKERG